MWTEHIASYVTDTTGFSASIVISCKLHVDVCILLVMDNAMLTIKANKSNKVNP